MNADQEPLEPMFELFEHGDVDGDAEVPSDYQIDQYVEKLRNTPKRKSHKDKPSKKQPGRIERYGSQVFMSGRYFVNMLSETFKNIGVAVSGSFLLLPVVIIVRGLSVIWSDIFVVVRDLIMSLFRGIFEGLWRLISPIHSLFTYYNKRVLFPLMKQIKEDDTTAMAAFIVLMVVIAGLGVSLWLIF